MGACVLCQRLTMMWVDLWSAIVAIFRQMFVFLMFLFLSSRREQMIYTLIRMDWRQY